MMPCRITCGYGRALLCSLLVVLAGTITSAMDVKMIPYEKTDAPDPSHPTWNHTECPAGYDKLTCTTEMQKLNAKIAELNNKITTAHARRVDHLAKLAKVSQKRLKKLDNSAGKRLTRLKRREEKRLRKLKSQYSKRLGYWKLTQQQEEATAKAKLNKHQGHMKRELSNLNSRIQQTKQETSKKLAKFGERKNELHQELKDMESRISSLRSEKKALASQYHSQIKRLKAALRNEQRAHRRFILRVKMLVVTNKARALNFTSQWLEKLQKKLAKLSSSHFADAHSGQQSKAHASSNAADTESSSFVELAVHEAHSLASSRRLRHLSLKSQRRLGIAKRASVHAFDTGKRRSQHVRHRRTKYLAAKLEKIDVHWKRGVNAILRTLHQRYNGLRKIERDIQSIRGSNGSDVQMQSLQALLHMQKPAPVPSQTVVNRLKRISDVLDTLVTNFRRCRTARCSKLQSDGVKEHLAALLEVGSNVSSDDWDAAILSQSPEEVGVDLQQQLDNILSDEGSDNEQALDEPLNKGPADDRFAAPLPRDDGRGPQHAAEEAEVAMQSLHGPTVLLPGVGDFESAAKELVVPTLDEAARDQNRMTQVTAQATPSQGGAEAQLAPQNTTKEEGSSQKRHRKWHRRHSASSFKGGCRSHADCPHGKLCTVFGNANVGKCMSMDMVTESPFASTPEMAQLLNDTQWLKQHSNELAFQIRDLQARVAEFNATSRIQLALKLRAREAAQTHWQQVEQRINSLRNELRLELKKQRIHLLVEQLNIRLTDFVTDFENSTNLMLASMSRSADVEVVEEEGRELQALTLATYQKYNQGLLRIRSLIQQAPPVVRSVLIRKFKSSIDNTKARLQAQGAQIERQMQSVLTLAERKQEALVEKMRQDSLHQIAAQQAWARNVMKERQRAMHERLLQRKRMLQQLKVFKKAARRKSAEQRDTDRLQHMRQIFELMKTEDARRKQEIDPLVETITQQRDLEQARNVQKHIHVLNVERNQAVLEAWRSLSDLLSDADDASEKTINLMSSLLRQVEAFASRVSSEIVHVNKEAEEKVGSWQRSSVGTSEPANNTRAPHAGPSAAPIQLPTEQPVASQAPVQTGPPQASKSFTFTTTQPFPLVPNSPTPAPSPSPVPQPSEAPPVRMTPLPSSIPSTSPPQVIQLPLTSQSPPSSSTPQTSSLPQATQAPQVSQASQVTQAPPVSPITQSSQIAVVSQAPPAYQGQPPAAQSSQPATIQAPQLAPTMSSMPQVTAATQQGQVQTTQAPVSSQIPQAPLASPTVSQTPQSAPESTAPPGTPQPLAQAQFTNNQQASPSTASPAPKEQLRPSVEQGRTDAPQHAALTTRPPMDAIVPSPPQSAQDFLVGLLGTSHPAPLSKPASPGAPANTGEAAHEADEPERLHGHFSPVTTSRMTPAKVANKWSESAYDTVTSWLTPEFMELAGQFEEPSIQEMERGY